jgi:hypothetical protein
MQESTDPIRPPWSKSPTAKTKNAVQRCVTALLDELAPERVLRRAEGLPPTVEQHRTPSGCVLQAPGAALSVSWFAEASDDSALGELRVIVWKGTVTRRGGRGNRKVATVVTEIVLAPDEPAEGSCNWRTGDGARYDTASLTAKCLELLEAQIGAGE